MALANLRRLDRNVLVTEDLLTRAFVHLLNNDPPVLKSYARRLRIPFSVGLTARDQDALGRNRPDMQITSIVPDVFVLQENKIESPEGLHQRRRYVNDLKRSKAKHRLLVYVEPRTIRKIAIQRKAAKGIRQDFLTWEQIASLVASAPHRKGKQRWMRAEFLEFLKERKLVYPSPLNVRKLTSGLLLLEQEKETLERIFVEAKTGLGKILPRKQFRVSIGDDERSLSIKKIARGRLKKPMSDGYIWVSCGVYPFEKTSYLSMEIGWVKKSYSTRIKTFRKKAEASGFYPSEYEHERYICECYETYDQFERIVGRISRYENQCANVSRWITAKTKILLKLLQYIEKDLGPA